ncbi:hypothetical protein B296_00030028, partial [Ensete ventricosum]
MYYADHPLPGGRLREKSTVDGRFQPSVIDFDRQRSIEGEKRKKKKKKRKRRKKKKEVPLSPRSPRLRTVAALARGRFFSRARRWNVSLHGEKDRGD